MRLLFVHQGFPAQFQHVIAGLLARGHKVHGIGAGEPPWVPYGCRYHAYSPPDPAELPQGLSDPGLELSLIRAERVASLGARLAAAGIDPQVIVFHSAWGEGLYLRNVWPQARLIVYPELFGIPSLLDNGDPDAPPLSIERLHLLERNNFLSLSALAAADGVLIPTVFQRDTFPAPWRGRFQVIHEGVDIERIRPDPARRIRLSPELELGSDDLVLTFVSRTLEPLRGFCRFMAVLPGLLAAHPRLRVVIAGANGHCYSPPSPHPGGYLAAMQERHAGQLDPERVHVLGFLGRDQLTALLQVSTVHAYLSYPYILSWSLLEAMACGTVVVASDTAPVRELIQHGVNGWLVPLDQTDAIEAGIDAVLRDPVAHAPLGIAARDTVVHRFDRRRCVEALCTWVSSLAMLP
ncbi:MAG: glycosyltransferase [Prochlorococcaceae cyanobacterium]